jgi:hypothetical protein
MNARHTRPTQAKDDAWLERVVANWREEYHNPSFTKDNVACNGCLGANGLHCSHCSECAGRLCGLAKGVVNCGACSEYSSCEKIQGFLKYVPTAKAVLDEVHAGMS